MYRAVRDTCALVPSLQRHFILQVATKEAYAPLWGSGILFELDYVLADHHRNQPVEAAVSRDMAPSHSESPAQSGHFLKRTSTREWTPSSTPNRTRSQGRTRGPSDPSHRWSSGVKPTRFEPMPSQCAKPADGRGSIPWWRQPPSLDKRSNLN